MHAEALGFIRTAIRKYGPFDTVVDIGGRDINGSPRSLFMRAQYTSVDLEPGPGVDVVADAQLWRPPQRVDAAICAEVAEHCPEPQRLITACWEFLNRGGLLIFTAASDGRPAHSAVDGGPLRAGEHYRNIGTKDLQEWLGPFESFEIQQHTERGDIYALAWR